MTSRNQLNVEDAITGGARVAPSLQAIIEEVGDTIVLSIRHPRAARAHHAGRQATCPPRARGLLSPLERRDQERVPGSIEQLATVLSGEVSLFSMLSNTRGSQAA